MKKAGPGAGADVYRIFHPVRVGYVDTDQAQVVHHSKYLHYMEAARVEYLRSRGMVYKAVELDSHEEGGFGLPVVEVTMKYRLPARFDDELRIETWVGKLARATLRFDYVVWRGDERLGHAKITLACVRLPSGRPRRMPAMMAEICDPAETV
ncbi:MAG: thioesterase family protein [Myxococcota bacterium]